MTISEFRIRERIEEKEESLSPYARRSVNSLGRLRPEAPCPVRTAFQRDRDRIIHSKAFRRLKHKTQVFIMPLGDHFSTRLTHTLEVAQIARTIARALNLNEDLTEAVALGHDLGHTPFGHAGEETLNRLCSSGFQHAAQSLRVVDILEKDGRGLNLTMEVRDGILNHSKPRESILGGERLSTFEGEVCRISDSVAYINHDIDDAIRAGTITQGDLPGELLEVLGNSHSARINTMVSDVITCSWGVSGEGDGLKPAVAMSPEVLKAADELREFLFSRVYMASSVQAEAERAKRVLERLYYYFVKHQEKLPPEYLLYSDNPEQRVVDYIAGMTDQFALRTAGMLS
ncbi:MAG: deoxyguanosinetriphosphate triphosphohydrolase [Chloroflexota bacterium]